MIQEVEFDELQHEIVQEELNALKERCEARGISVNIGSPRPRK